ncbi:Nn.00g072120.m01.CDS01 [Neocucurbitaria sp. VM-36]
MASKRKGKKAVFGKKELKMLYASYGEDDLYNSGNFKSMTRNLTTGKMLHRSHHCEQCNSKMSQTCYDNFHHAYCPTWVTRNIDGKRVRRRCGERFALRSDGCGKHPRVQGYNEPLYHAAEGHDVSLSDLDDSDPENSKGEPEDDEDDYEAEEKELERIAEEEIKKKGYLPKDFHSNYWRARAREQAFAMLKKGSATNNIEGVGEGLTAASRGQSKVIANGKAGAGKKTQKRGITFADNSHETHGPGRRTAFTYGSGEANLQHTRSFAPKGLKPEGLMEVPRGSVSGSKDEDATNTSEEKGKMRVRRWWNKMNGKGTTPE